jgi:murein DD-endopeptidase MepM/ murein hydrolase activator NlpD
MRKEKKRSKLWLILVLILVVVVPLAGFLVVRFEGTIPEAEINLQSIYLGRTQDISASVSDTGSGLRQVWMALLKDGKEIVLHDEAFPSAGILKGGSTQDATIKVTVAPPDMGFSDGKATLRMVVRDYSWRNWWKGNRAYIEKSVEIDTRPPDIEVLTNAHNISQGGAGLVIFRTSEPCSQSGVTVGGKFYPGTAGHFKDELIQMAFFALAHDQGRDTAIQMRAVDLAGNEKKSGLNHHIRRKKFRKDRINISDGFLRKKMPDFAAELPGSSSNPLVAKFLKINRNLRQANYRRIVEVCSQPSSRLYWQGGFLRLPNAANRAGFADRRSYYYKKKEIDRQVHLGIDLASLANSPIPAANSGIVVLAESLGIYGGTVILDHGFGLYSMYSHLSFIGVEPGQQVARGDILGRTGSTGLAGGDHLHFSVLVNDTFVNPVEWWDKKWIQNNVTSKIDRVKSILN